MLRKGTTLIVKLDGQRTLASDLAQAAIYQLIEQERQNPDWAFTLVVLASFDIPCYHVLGNLDLPCTVLGHDLEDPKSVEQALSSRCYNLDPQIDWDAYVEQLIMDADRQQDPSTIICFIPLASLKNSIHLAFSRNWKVCNTRTLQYQADFLEWYRYETSPLSSCALVVLDQIPDIMACSVDLPNIRDIVLARSTRKLMFDPVMGQVMENDVLYSRKEMHHQIGYFRKAQKPEDVAFHCNFNLDEALCTAPWNPNPTTEQKSAFEWFYACISKWPDTPVREWPVSFPYDRTLADSVASQLLWLEVIEPGDKTASFRIKTGWPKLISHFLPGGEIAPEGVFFNAALLFADVCSAFRERRLGEDETRILIRIAAILSYGINWPMDAHQDLVVFLDGDVVFTQRNRLLFSFLLPGVSKNMYDHGALWMLLGLWELYRKITTNFSSPEFAYGSGMDFKHCLFPGLFDIRPSVAGKIWNLVRVVEESLGLEVFSPTQDIPLLDPEQLQRVEVCLARGWLTNLLTIQKDPQDGEWRSVCILNKHSVCLDIASPGPDLDALKQDPRNQRERNFFLIYRHLSWAESSNVIVAEYPTRISRRAVAEAVGHRSLYDLQL
ncbi:hypothetical protein CH63R_04349 [Colletotrichum higginsianum IMI 349063]|uniref:Uncharacterized protein n=1 Tax=Colletotrichum higginsianum (strain IMI 349063) TaxID=759273 RepID=A0A1B7YIZ1_COLHI|nr:hypothetical protein CH63R_04349 [Colletotrichum higginsianum IMI 349063]OBR12053.1 hypothetical protein CH63R_04349 [Colletotrichum higginsianum IMI 349063]GJC93725.1 hypothetical protein ColKHC_02551 [Colletotrichum higginsianum]